jgi:hypothetical protein
LREFIALLNSHNVEYLVVGGHAVAFHGHPRFTGDIDFFVRTTSENAQRLLRVLDAFGFGGQTVLDDQPVALLGWTAERIFIVERTLECSGFGAWN